MTTKTISLLFGFIACLAFEQCVAQPAPLRVRKDFSQMTSSEKESLRRGIAAMKTRDASDPTSWQFQANIHGTPNPTGNPLHRQCQHGTRFFLVWHRGYLHYFEKILREAAQDPNLTLPYWDWPDQPTLPTEFRLPANNSNPLFDGSRSMNDGSALPQFTLQRDLTFAFRQRDFQRFQELLEGPHGTIHVMVGGLMGGVPTSANDPIFWLHHANVDRQWDHWLRDPTRRNPMDSQFLNRRFQYADADGSTVTVTAREILSSARLGYRYDDIPQIQETVVSAEVPAAEENLIAESAIDITESPDALKLGFAEKRIPLDFNEGGIKAMTSITESPVANQRVVIKIKGITLKKIPNFTYAVYLNLPEGEDNEQRMLPHYVGSIDFFSGAHGGHGEGHAEAGLGDEKEDPKFDAEIEVTDIIGELEKAGDWNPKSISVTLRPLSPVPPKDIEGEKSKEYSKSAIEADISYEKVEVLLER